MLTMLYHTAYSGVLVLKPGPPSALSSEGSQVWSAAVSSMIRK